MYEGDFYGLFFEKTNNKKGLYLQIYESFYDPERGHAAHKSYKPIGYVHELQAQGIDDPISYYKEEVAKLNQEFKAARNSSKEKQILEIKKEIEKAKLLKASQAKKSEYGDCARYVTFLPLIKKGMIPMGKSKLP